MLAEFTQRFELRPLGYYREFDTNLTQCGPCNITIIAT